MRIEKALMLGEENALHCMDLARIIGFSYGHTKELIRDARKRGVPILSSYKGYWLAKNDREIRMFARSQHKQGVSRIVMSNKMLETVEEIDGQTHLFDEDTIKGGGFNA